jgi:hypothetical protein
MMRDTEMKEERKGTMKNNSVKKVNNNGYMNIAKE